MKQNPFDNKRIPQVDRRNQVKPEGAGELGDIDPNAMQDYHEVQPQTSEKQEESYDSDIKLPPVKNLNAQLGEIDTTPAVDAPPQIQDPFGTGEKVYEKEEILPMMDALLLNGYATDSFKIRKTKIVLRTRFTWEEQDVYKRMEEANLNTAIAYQRAFATVYIAASLIQFGDIVFEPINGGSKEDLEKSMNDRVEFIESLNTVLTDIIQKKLYEFDDKQRYLIAHFDELLGDF